MKIAACFLEYDGKFLILLRNRDKPNGNTWGLPAGKAEADESSEDTVIRETYEETGYTINPDDLHYLADFSFGNGENRYDIVVYHVSLNQLVDVRLDPSAHQEYRWVTPEACYALPNLIPDFHEALEHLGMAGRRHSKGL